MPHGYFDRENHKSPPGTETNWNHQPMTTKATNIYLKTVALFDYVWLHFNQTYDHMGL